MAMLNIARLGVPSAVVPDYGFVCVFVGGRDLCGGIGWEGWSVRVRERACACDFGACACVFVTGH